MKPNNLYITIKEKSQVVPIKAWVQGVELEDEAKQQLINVASLPFVYKHVSVMPDVHAGMGATIGSVVATAGAVVPSVTGVDLGCGLIAVKTSLTANDLPENLLGIRTAIEELVPHGRSDEGGVNDKGAHKEPQEAKSTFEALNILVDKHSYLKRPAERARYQLGTLGTGNHFIELCLDESDSVWIMIHSGSRGIGNSIGTLFINKAKELMSKMYISLPDKDLAYLPESTKEYEEYLEAVGWAQEFALTNRKIMLELTIKALQKEIKKPFVLLEEAVNCHHNYVNKENHFGKNVLVTRKGALNAHKGVLGVIPGSMGAKSFIVRGKGNTDSFCSCSHGAGRKMSRTKARATFSIDDHIKATLGIECRKDAEVLDETPMAYKDIDAVMKAQEDLVEIIHTLRQVVCIKG